MTEGKFLNLWAKYLPVIRILLKRSVNEEQQLSLDKMELNSVDNRKNATYSFNLEILKGKVQNNIGGAAIGKDLFKVLSNDVMVNDFMNDKTIILRMGKDFKLKLKSDPA
jgi:hypothetical protein